MSPADVKTTWYDQHWESGGYGYAEKRDKWVKWTQRNYVRSFRLRPGETLLDCGCGDGFWTSLFHEKGFVCTGVDISVKGIETAKRLYPGPEYLVRNAEEPMFDPPRQFDIVFCRTISHICMKPLMNPRALKAMANMADCVAPGGLFLLSYNSRRNRENQKACADHTMADLIALVEPFLDPFRFELVGNYLQVAAQRRDHPR